MITATRTAIARIPGSKSITNRALLLAAAAHGTSRLRAPLVSDDTLTFRRALGVLGVEVTTEGEDWLVTGAGRGPRGTTSIWCADAGTAARFLPVLAATGEGEFLFDGSHQLRSRPLVPLVETLGRLGVDVVPGQQGGLPLMVRARGLPGGAVTLDSSTSSQYLTGLLLSAPLAKGPLTIGVQGLVSSPYIDMTLALMRHFGAVVEVSGTGELHVTPGPYRAADLAIEPDASTASYFFAAAAVTGTTLTVPGLGCDSLQGDLRFVEVLEHAGARVRLTADSTSVTGTGALRGGFTVDMGEISDTFMTLAAIAPLADAPISITSIAHARLKESDRISAVARNLRAAGIRVDEETDRLTIHPGTPAPTRVACHRDHRIAMAFSVLGLCVDGLTFDDPACVSKTFPGFQEELQRLFPVSAGTTA